MTMVMDPMWSCENVDNLNANAAAAKTLDIFCQLTRHVAATTLQPHPQQPAAFTPPIQRQLPLPLIPSVTIGPDFSCSWFNNIQQQSNGTLFGDVVVKLEQLRDVGDVLVQSTSQPVPPLVKNVQSTSQPSEGLDNKKKDEKSVKDEIVTGSGNNVTTDHQVVKSKRKITKRRYNNFEVTGDGDGDDDDDTEEDEDDDDIDDNHKNQKEKGDEPDHAYEDDYEDEDDQSPNDDDDNHIKKTKRQVKRHKSENVDDLKTTDPKEMSCDQIRAVLQKKINGIRLNKDADPQEELTKLHHALQPYNFSLCSSTYATYNLSVPRLMKESLITDMKMFKFNITFSCYLNSMLFVKCQVSPHQFIQFALKVKKTMSSVPKLNAFFSAEQYILFSSENKKDDDNGKDKKLEKDTVTYVVVSQLGRRLYSVIGGEVRHNKLSEPQGRPLKSNIMCLPKLPFTVQIYTTKDSTFVPPVPIIQTKKKQRTDSRILVDESTLKFTAQ